VEYLSDERGEMTYQSCIAASRTDAVLLEEEAKIDRKSLSQHFQDVVDMKA
jgi:hypothetical protein